MPLMKLKITWNEAHLDNRGMTASNPEPQNTKEIGVKWPIHIISAAFDALSSKVKRSEDRLPALAAVWRRWSIVDADIIFNMCWKCPERIDLFTCASIRPSRHWNGLGKHRHNTHWREDFRNNFKLSIDPAEVSGYIFSLPKAQFLCLLNANREERNERK